MHTHVKFYYIVLEKKYKELMMKTLKAFYLLLALFLVSCGHYGKGLKHLDTNGDKQITKEEWTSSHDLKFTELDKNADGVITEDEISKCGSCHDKKKDCDKKEGCDLKKSECGHYANKDAGDCKGDCKGESKEGCEGDKCKKSE